MKIRLLELIKKKPLATFFLLAFAITWIGSTVYALSLPKNGPVLPSFLTFPGGLVWYFGPCLSAVLVTCVSHEQVGLRDLAKRLLDWRVNWKWYAFIVLYPLALHFAVVYLDRLLGGPVPVFFQAEGVPAGNPWLVLLLLIVYQVLVRGIGEETGWRGFAMPCLQERLNSLAASLILGALWALWHFHPANFPGLLSLSGVFIFLNIALTAVVFTWVYNHTHGSVLIAALFHMTLNVTEFIMPIGIVAASPSRHILQVVLITAFVITLVIIGGQQLGQDNLEQGGK
jgi:membrane protease YdiL (CAAX protease family)